MGSKMQFWKTLSKLLGLRGPLKKALMVRGPVSQERKPGDFCFKSGREQGEDVLWWHDHKVAALAAFTTNLSASPEVYL